MEKIVRFWKIILLDTLGVIFMIGAILTGWLPGPGGIPLFIIGLGLLAVNHEWAKKYIDLLRQYADRLGDLVFIKKPVVQWLYDILSLGMLTASVYLLLQRTVWWQLSLSVFLFFLGLTLFLGNRDRWAKIKSHLKHKH